VWIFDGVVAPASIRSNCRMIKYAGLFYRAINGHHMNYKEGSTSLRMAGAPMDNKKICSELKEINSPKSNEKIEKAEVDAFLKDEFNMTIQDLPPAVQSGLNAILK